jgi:hypothetical protein
MHVCHVHIVGYVCEVIRNSVTATEHFQQDLSQTPERSQRLRSVAYARYGQCSGVFTSSNIVIYTL